MEPLSPQQLTGGFNRKDQLTQSEIFTKHVQRVHDMVDRLTGHSPESEELVSDIFMRVFNSEQPVTAAFQIRDRINIITLRVCQDHLKREKSRKERASGVAEFYMSISSEDMELAELYGEMGNFLWQEIEKILPKTRNVMVLAVKGLLTNKEIAVRLGMSLKTVANHKTEALKILRIAAKRKGGMKAFHLFVLTLNLLYENF